MSLSVVRLWRIPMRKLRLFLWAAAVLAAASVPSCSKRNAGTLVFVGQGDPDANAAARSCLVVVTHGWIEGGAGDWAQEIALAVQKRVDANVWLCGYFDWSKGSQTVNPTDAAKYARDIAGGALAEQILRRGSHWRHIHLLGHSCGAWAVSEAAKILAQKTNADIHLTFFDAYIPPHWQEGALGDVNTAGNAVCWAEQYYTRDLTLAWTQENLSHAHNVDITNIDSVLKDHNFPWQWYLATVAGEYVGNALVHKGKPVTCADGIEYGFGRSLEAGGAQAWRQSLNLRKGNEAARVRKQ